MFYTYDLSFDRSSTLSYDKALNVTSAEVGAVTPRAGANLLPLSVRSAQNICGRLVNPWSSGFSSDFGSEIPDNYVLVTVNKFIRAANAEAAAMSKIAFALNRKVLAAASSQVAALTQRHIASAILPVISVEVIRLVLARPWHVIVAAQTTIPGMVLKLASKLLGVAGANPFSQEFSPEFGPTSLSAAVGISLGHNYGVVSSETVSLLKRVGALRGALIGEAARSIKAVGKAVLSARLSLVTATPRTNGKPLASASPEVASIKRGLPWRLNAALAEIVSIGFGGGNLFVRALGALSGEALALRRGQAILRGLQEPNAAGIMRAPGRTFFATSAEAMALLKQACLLRGTTDGQVATSRRQPGTARGVVATAAVAMRTAAAHTASALTTFGAEIAALFTQRVVGRSLLIPRSQFSSVSISAVVTLLRSLAVASAQTAGVVRGIGSLVSALTGATQRVGRSEGKILGAASAGVISLMQRAAHFLSAGISWLQVVQQRASYSSLRGATSPESAAVSRRRGSRVAATQVNVASLQRRLTTLLSAVTGQVTAVGVSIGKAFLLPSQGVVATVKGVSRLLVTALAQSSSIITRHGSALGTAVNTQVAAVRRLTNKLLLWTAPETVSGGRGGFKRIGTTSTEVAFMIRPRGLSLPARQGQIARTASYYHFYVSTWAAQQSVLLPPGGGSPEPPSFGPIDPADQTIFAFDWSSRAYRNDTITSAVVTSVPSGLQFLAGSLFISGSMIEITVPPFVAPTLPTMFSLRCTATFASGRVSSFSIPVPVRIL